MYSMSKYIDQIFYINLDHRTDKKEYMERQLEALGLPFERFPAVNQVHNGVGCTKSHLEIYKIAKARGYKAILILEDDFTFSVSKEEYETSLTQLFESAPEFDVCFVSNTTIYEDAEIPGCAFLKRALDVHGSEGYITQSHYFDRLIGIYESAAELLEQTGMHWLYTMDRAWVPFLKQDNWFRFINRLGRQNRDLKSDII